MVAPPTHQLQICEITYSVPMPNMTLAIDAETAKEIRSHREIRWSEVARDAIRRKIQELHALDTAFANSKLTKADIDRLARRMNANILKRLGR